MTNIRKPNSWNFDGMTVVSYFTFGWKNGPSDCIWIVPGTYAE